MCDFYLVECQSPKESYILVKFVVSFFSNVQFGIREQISYGWVYLMTLPFGLHVCGSFYASYLAETWKGTILAEVVSAGTREVLVWVDSAGLPKLR